jgi:hypothetical protein
MFDTVTAAEVPVQSKRDSTHNFTNNPLPDGGANNPNYLLAIHLRVRPAEQHDEPRQADPRLDPDEQRRPVVRSQLGEGGITTT